MSLSLAAAGPGVGGLLWNMAYILCCTVCSYAVARRFLPVQESRLRRLLPAAAHALAVGNVVYIGDPVNILYLLPVFFAAFLIGYEGGVLSRLSLAGLMFTMTMSLNAALDNGGDWTWGEATVPSALIERLGRVLCWLLILLIIRRVVRRPVVPLSGRMWAMLDALGVLPFLTTLIIVVGGDFRYDYPDGRLMLILRLVLLCAALLSFGLLLMLALLARHEQLERERALWQSQGYYYRNLEESQAQVRSLRHDMANHLQVLAGLSGGAVREYVGQLLSSPAMNAQGRVCENEVVNAVVAGKASLMQEYGVSAHYLVQLPAQLPVADVDLCALFANALDNAIDACRKLPEGKRELTLRARCDQGILVMECENPCAEPPPRQHGRWVTSKPDPARHGFGLQSIRQVAEHYGGSMSAEYYDGRFVLLVSLRV